MRELTSKSEISEAIRGGGNVTHIFMGKTAKVIGARIHRFYLQVKHEGPADGYWIDVHANDKIILNEGENAKPN